MANDAVSSIRTVASFCAEQKVMDLYKKKCEAPVKYGRRQGIVSGTGYSISFVVLYCTYALIFYVGAKFVENGSATGNQVFRVSSKLVDFIFSYWDSHCFYFYLLFNFLIFEFLLE